MTDGQCQRLGTSILLGCEPDGRAVVAELHSEKITSDAGALPLGVMDRVIRPVGRYAKCPAGNRAPELVEREVVTLVGQSRDYAGL